MRLEVFQDTHTKHLGVGMPIVSKIWLYIYYPASKPLYFRLYSSVNP